MTRLDASDLAQRLGREAEAVCRLYVVRTFETVGVRI